MSETNHIPVVFSCDENYAMPLCVSLLSLLKKAKKTTFYEIYVLLETDFSSESKEKILSLRKKYPNCQITFFVIGSEFDDAYVSIHITKAAYFRLKIASLLPDITKCLYLDCDLLVLKDLTELFETNLESHLLAGVKASGMYEEAKLRRGLKPETIYINSGVLVLNLEKIRLENMEQEFLSLAKISYQYHDQDIINVACEGRIKILDFKYNLPAYTFYQEGGQIKHGTRVETNYSEEEINTALKNRVILHYSGTHKPWNKKDMFYGEIWWMYHDEVLTLKSQDNND